MTDAEYEELTTPSARFRLEPAGLVVCVLKKRPAHALADAEENVRMFARYCRTRRRPILIDLSAQVTMDREARNFYRSPACYQYLTACAMVAGTPLARAIANVTMAVTVKDVPTRLFGTRDEARDWLLGLMRTSASM